MTVSVCLLQADFRGSAQEGGIKHAIQLTDAAALNPVAYLNGLAKAITDLGGKIYEGTRVLKPSRSLVETASGYKVCHSFLTSPSANSNANSSTTMQVHTGHLLQDCFIFHCQCFQHRNQTLPHALCSTLHCAGCIGHQSQEVWQTCAGDSAGCKLLCCVHSLLVLYAVCRVLHAMCIVQRLQTFKQ